MCMNLDKKSEDNYQSRRRFPRREMHRKVGVLCRGHYVTYTSLEIGEGGMSIQSSFVLDQQASIVVTFQIPGAGFVSLQGEVRSTQKKDSEDFVTHGVVFRNIEFSHKRLIRSYVSARNLQRNLV